MNLSALLIIRIKNKVKMQFLKSSNLFKFIEAQNKVVLFFLIKIFKSILAAVGVFFLYKAYLPAYKDYWNSLIFIFIITETLISSINVYKKTFFPRDLVILKASPLNNIEIYVLLTLEEYLWKFLSSIETYFTVFLLIFLINKSKFGFIFYYYMLIIFFSFFFFVTSNVLTGLYKIEIIKKPIGFFRFLVYLINQFIFFKIGMLIVVFLYKPIIIFKKAFFLKGNLNLTKDTIETFSKTITNDWLYAIKNTTVNFLCIVKDFYVYVVEKISNSIALQLEIPCVILLVIYLIFMFFSPKYENNQKIKTFNGKKKDFLYYYILLLKKINIILHKKNFLLEKELNILNNSRWLVSATFYQAVLANYDFSFLLGVVITILNHVNNFGYYLSIVIVFNILAIFNQLTELKNEYTFIYTLSTERKNINLIKASGNSTESIYNAKLKLLRLNLIFPIIISFFISIYLLLKSGYYINLKFYFSNSMIFLCLIYTLWIAPISVLYMDPLLARFDYKNTEELIEKRFEDTIYEKFRQLPRMISISPFLVILYLNIYLEFLNKIKDYLPIIFFIYFIFVNTTFKIFFDTIKEKGIKKINDENIYV